MVAMTLRRRAASERGAELVEFAFSFPLLLLVLFAIFDFGLMMQRFEVLTNAAREGARMGSLATPYSNQEIKDRVMDYIAAGTGTTVADLQASGKVTIPDPVIENLGGVIAGVQPTLIRVNITYRYDFEFLGGIGSLFGGSYTNLPLNATAAMRQETSAVAP
jgi:hypothetical protein